MSIPTKNQSLKTLRIYLRECRARDKSWRSTVDVLLQRARPKETNHRRLHVLDALCIRWGYFPHTSDAVGVRMSASQLDAWASFPDTAAAEGRRIRKGRGNRAIRRILELMPLPRDLPVHLLAPVEAYRNRAYNAKRDREELDLSPHNDGPKI